MKVRDVVRLDAEARTRTSAAGARKRARVATRDVATLVASSPLRPSVIAAIAAVTLLLATTIAYEVSALGETVYGARAEVLFDRDSDAFFEWARDMETQRELLRSGVVLAPVAREARMSVDALDEALSVEVKGESDVLRLTVADPDAARARALAGSIAESYVRALAVPGSTDRARVVTPADVRDDPHEPKTLRAAAAALVVILILAGLVVALRHPRLRR
jgi:capsular polysaccharide biosynthesis protein